MVFSFCFATADRATRLQVVLIIAGAPPGLHFLTYLADLLMSLAPGIIVCAMHKDSATVVVTGSGGVAAAKPAKKAAKPVAAASSSDSEDSKKPSVSKSLPKAPTAKRPARKAYASLAPVSSESSDISSGEEDLEEETGRYDKDLRERHREAV